MFVLAYSAQLACHPFLLSEIVEEMKTYNTYVDHYVHATATYNVFTCMSQ